MVQSKSPRHAAAGAKGGKARLHSMTPEERSARAKAAVEARWARPTPESVVIKMVAEIYRTRSPMALYRRDQALWFSSPNSIEAPRWQDYLIGTYGIGVLEEDVMADVMAG